MTWQLAIADSFSKVRAWVVATERNKANHRQWQLLRARMRDKKKDGHDPEAVAATNQERIRTPSPLLARPRFEPPPPLVSVELALSRRRRSSFLSGLASPVVSRRRPPLLQPWSCLTATSEPSLRTRLLPLLLGPRPRETSAMAIASQLRTTRLRSDHALPRLLSAPPQVTAALPLP